MIHFAKILFVLVLSSWSNPDTRNSSEPVGDDEKLFLEQIRSGLDSIGNDDVKLISYEKLGSINSEENKMNLISNILSEEEFLFISYNPRDIALTDLEVKTYKALKSQQNFSKAESEKLDHILSNNRESLEKIIKTGYSEYSITWEIKGKRLKTRAIFNGEEFVYDNLISHLIFYEVKTLKPSKK